MLKKSIFLLSLPVFCSLQYLYAQSYFNREYLGVWKRSTTYSLEVAKQMPDSLYEYKPTQQSMSFKEQQLHAVSNISFLTQYITGESKVFYEKNSLKDLSKKDILEIFAAAFLYVDKVILESDSASIAAKVVFKGVDMSKENIFYLIRNHLSHHRAQSNVYLRMNEINPPQYVGW
jgi:uncharacterized damage-inducible protein DinB